jgi:radical SAM-linked protein
MLRLRIDYSKEQGLRYTSNLDIHRIWERTFRRARLPLAYSQGFHPQPKINQAAPLPLGLLSRAEMVDIWLEEDVSLEEVASKLAQAVPPGLHIHHIQAIDAKVPALPTLVRSAEYLVIFLNPISAPELAANTAALLEQTQCLRDRRGKPYDLRPLVQELVVIPGKNLDDQPRLIMRLSARESATGRPDEVLLALNLDPFAARIERTSLILEPPA